MQYLSFNHDEIFRFMSTSDKCINVLEDYIKRMILWWKRWNSFLFNFF